MWMQFVVSPLKPRQIGIQEDEAEVMDVAIKVLVLDEL